MIHVDTVAIITGSLDLERSADVGSDVGFGVGVEGFVGSIA